MTTFASALLYTHHHQPLAHREITHKEVRCSALVALISLNTSRTYPTAKLLRVRVVTNKCTNYTCSTLTVLLNTHGRTRHQRLCKLPTTIWVAQHPEAVHPCKMPATSPNTKRQLAWAIQSTSQKPDSLLLCPLHLLHSPTTRLTRERRRGGCATKQ